MSDRKPKHHILTRRVSLDHSYQHEVTIVDASEPHDSRRQRTYYVEGHDLDSYPLMRDGVKSPDHYNFEADYVGNKATNIRHKYYRHGFSEIEQDYGMDMVFEVASKILELKP